MFKYSSSKEIELATVTPSLVILKPNPYFSCIKTVLPFVPSVVFTTSAVPLIPSNNFSCDSFPFTIISLSFYCSLLARCTVLKINKYKH